MTSQIVIKLNEKKFKRIIDELKHGIIAKSNSELVGFCVWYCYLCKNERVPELENKTRFGFLSEKMGSTNEEHSLKILQKYNDFLTNKSKINY